MTWLTSVALDCLRAGTAWPRGILTTAKLVILAAGGVAGIAGFVFAGIGVLDGTGTNIGAALFLLASVPGASVGAASSIVGVFVGRKAAAADVVPRPAIADERCRRSHGVRMAGWPAEQSSPAGPRADVGNRAAVILPPTRKSPARRAGHKVNWT